MGKEVDSHEGHHGAGQHGPKGVLDFSHKHELFEVHLEKVGPEFSELEDRKRAFAEQNGGKYVPPEPAVPANWPGLVMRRGELPATRKWWVPGSSYERNGFLNLKTPRTQKRVMPLLFFTLVVYGWVGNHMNGYYF
jgi:hypothetical protein